MFAQIARDGDRLERLLLAKSIMIVCFGLRAKRLGRPGLRARRWLTSAFVCRFQNPDIFFLRIKIKATVPFSALLGPDNHGQAVKKVPSPPEAPAPAAEPAARVAPRRETADTAADLGAADRRGVRS
jgi:hypothetical protein